MNHKTMRFLPRRKFYRIAALSLVPGALWLLYSAARTRTLLDNGRQIGERAATFPRDTFVGEAGAPALTYLVMGDSTAAGWGAADETTTYPHLIARAAAERGFSVHLVNVAVGGATIGDVAASQIAAIARVHPDLITLSVGANDATHFTNLDDYQRDFALVLAALQGSKARTILVADTPDMFLAPALPLPIAAITARRARAQNEILRALAQGSRVQIVELYDKGKLDARLNPDFYAADWFHPSSAGYARWARLFIAQLGR